LRSENGNGAVVISSFRSGWAMDTSRLQLRAKLRECEGITKPHFGAQDGR